MRLSSLWPADGVPTLPHRHNPCYSALEWSWPALLSGECRSESVLSGKYGIDGLTYQGADEEEEVGYAPSPGYRQGFFGYVSGRTSYKGLWPENHSRAAERRLVRGVGPLVAVRLVERCRQTPFQPGPELVVSPAQLRAVEQRGHVLG